MEFVTGWRDQTIPPSLPGRSIPSQTEAAFDYVNDRASKRPMSRYFGGYIGKQVYAWTAGTVCRAPLRVVLDWGPAPLGQPDVLCLFVYSHASHDATFRPT